MRMPVSFHCSHCIISFPLSQGMPFRPLAVLIFSLWSCTTFLFSSALLRYDTVMHLFLLKTPRVLHAEGLLSEWRRGRQLALDNLSSWPFLSSGWPALALKIALPETEWKSVSVLANGQHLEEQTETSVTSEEKYRKRAACKSNLIAVSCVQIHTGLWHRGERTRASTSMFLAKCVWEAREKGVTKPEKVSNESIR